MIINTVRGAQASAVVYSITETARANGLNVYYYVKHLLEQLVTLNDAQSTNGPIRIDPEKIKPEQLEPFMPWSKTLPDECYSKRRK